MRKGLLLTAKGTALAICFASLYVILSFLPLSQLIGLFGKAITAATVISPILGIILGPYLSAISTILGGAICLFVSPYFSPPSFVAGCVASFFAGLLSIGMRKHCVFIYVSLMFIFVLYPFIGPFWLYPQLTWFQVIGLLILISPLQSKAIKVLNSGSSSRLLFAFFLTSLTSTLASQIAGSLVFEALWWPTLIPDIHVWELYWQSLTFLYPIERIIIALVAALIGVALHKTLKSANLTPITFDTASKRIHKDAFFKRHHHIRGTIYAIIQIHRSILNQNDRSSFGSFTH